MITATSKPSRAKPNQTSGRDLEHLGERIAELAARISAATLQLLELIREFDEREGWNCGFRTCAHWLSWRTGLSLGPAREKVRVARALGELPRISGAMRSGGISYSKVRALTRVATPETEEELLAFANAGTAMHVERVVRAWRRLDREEEREREARRHVSRYLHAWTDEDGMVVVRGRLEPEAGAVFLKALEAAAEVLYDEERERETADKDGLPVAQRRADAAGRVAEAALAGGLDRGTRGERYQVVVHVDAAVLEDGSVPAGTFRRRPYDASSVVAAPDASRGLDAGESGMSMLETEDVSAETSRRIACDAAKVVMIHDPKGRVLDVGRRTRVISPALRRALSHRDQGCRFPGCCVSFCDAHHIRHWAEGGETKLDNLVLLCRKHHRSVHEEGYRVELGADGEGRFLRPDGREISEAPALPDIPGEDSTPLVGCLTEAGVDVDEMGGSPEWDGSALDLAWAVDALRTAVVSGTAG